MVKMSILISAPLVIVVIFLCIKTKIDIFSDFLGRLEIKFLVIGISETWLDDSFHCVDIPGYNFLHNIISFVWDTNMAAMSTYTAFCAS